MRLVLDASMALAWLFERQKSNELECAERALLALETADVTVPSLWHIEIANALLVGERRNVVTEAQVMDYLNRLVSLPIKTDDTTTMSRRDSVMAFARQHTLSAYDAVYLDLALRKNATLATFDMKLAAAMRNAGGAVYS